MHGQKNIKFRRTSVQQLFKKDIFKHNLLLYFCLPVFKDFCKQFLVPSGPIFPSLSSICIRSTFRLCQTHCYCIIYFCILKTVCDLRQRPVLDVRPYCCVL